MSKHPVAWSGAPWNRELVFPRSEQLFQALRFPPDHPILDDMLSIENPMAAKMRVAGFRNEMVVRPTTALDVGNMRRVLEAKLDQHPEIQESLRRSGAQEIVEDCSSRTGGTGLFWGAALRDGIWVGDNQLGKLWMLIRDRWHSS